MKKISILIPTCNRPNALAVTLTSLCLQNYKNFDVIISDQSKPKSSFTNGSVQATLRVLSLHGSQVKTYRHLPRLGMAEQRHFLIEKSQSPYSLFIDDDLILEPFVLKNMLKTIEKERCGFVGCGVIGLSFINDVRPKEQKIEFWKGKVRPEKIEPSYKKWKRFLLHNAANLYHVEKKYKLTPEKLLKYKVAWIGGCTLYDTKKLKASGGFDFWKDIPFNHSGEDVMAQLKVMQKYGGCGIIPSGVYHQELPTTIKNRQVNVPTALFTEAT